MLELRRFAAEHYAVLMFLAGAGLMSQVTLLLTFSRLAWHSCFGQRDEVLGETAEREAKGIIGHDQC